MIVMSDDANTSLAKRDTAGFFSNATGFFLPVGQQFDAGSVRGYYIDMRVKAEKPIWEGGEDRLYVVGTQWALGCYERYLAGEGEAWLAAAIDWAEELVRRQHPQGMQAGGFLHARAYPHTFPVRPPWISAMAQGEAASLLVRIYLETGDERFAVSARRALLPLCVDSLEGGVRAALGKGSFPEEYPTQPPSCVLNGGIFALWGLYDVGVALDHASARVAFRQAVDTLAENLYRWDVGYWSRYDLFPHATTNIASSFYHDLHINQLRAMHRLVARRQLAETADRWADYAASPLSCRRAFARKALFRLLVPRSRWLATRLPWSRLRGL